MELCTCSGGVEMKPNEQIKAARKRAGITQGQLSLCCGLDQPSLSKIENGTGNPTLETLEKISKCLGEPIVIPNT